MANQPKTKTAIIVIYPMKGTNGRLCCNMEYKGDVIWQEYGTRHELAVNARNEAKKRGFTHARIFHEYVDHPASGGARVTLV